MAKQFYFRNNEFIIENYDKAKTFSSFLPGIAGLKGTPLWSFYVNRGQCMGSFGVKDKDNCIMEFFPANIMYKNVELQGFRTFIKFNNEIHEIFSSISFDRVTRRMIIEKNILKIEEENETLGIKARVTYFTVPNENYGALVRRLEIENCDIIEKQIEVVDGLTQIIPYGVKLNEFQQMANLFRAWFDVYNLDNNIAYYKVRATTDDSAEVGEVEKGHFYLAFSSESKELIPPIVDIDTIFGKNTSLTKPDGWNCSINELNNRKQISVNKVSGGFCGAEVRLRDRFVLCSLIGHAAKPEEINSIKSKFTLQYIDKKEKEARELIDNMTDDTFTQTSNPLFDKYIEQCYLDNIMRGGYPLIFKSNKKKQVYHVYSRKHGDLEREYNFFSLEPASYSQGNGNFRDVNQNRRNDVLFYPEVEDFNIKQFMDLIQIDGYNPLQVKGSTFKYNLAFVDDILKDVINGKKEVKEFLKHNFTPGTLISFIKDKDIKLTISDEKFLIKIIKESSQSFEAEFGEGYWTDHWTYNMDLIETFLMIYPDRVQKLVFDDNDYKFYDSVVRVLPREDKYVLVKGCVRQYDSIIMDKEKSNRLGISIKDTNWLKTNYGVGGIYQTNLYVKLISLALNKFITMDPHGMGIEMEANKPGWNDAMNGLPGIFGSGVGETSELKRIIKFIIDVSEKYDKDVVLPYEVFEVLKVQAEQVEGYFNNRLDDFGYWEKSSTLREEYRAKVRYGISGKEEKINTKEVKKIFDNFSKKLDLGLQRALELGKGIYPTYIAYEPVKFQKIDGKVSPVNGYENVKVTEFKCIHLPLFLEGPARELKNITDIDAAEELYDAVKRSLIYDEKLNMYKTSESIENAPNEIGRIRAFTPGWLEREAIFLHMEYKYLLGMLKAGLYEEFFEDIQKVLVPFLNADNYGRSTLENSSFIASSVNPDPEVHGQGFVARLSGSTSEMLSMWFIMMAGMNPFTYDENELKLTLKPILPGWIFNKEGTVSYKFLSKTIVTYNNPQRLNTYSTDFKIENINLTTDDDQLIKIMGKSIGEPYSKLIREGKVKKIETW